MAKEDNEKLYDQKYDKYIKKACQEKTPEFRKK